MCFSSGPSYTPPAPAAPPKQPPKMADEAVQKARGDERRRAAAMGGVAGTVATGARGILTEATTTLNNTKQSLLGGA